MKRVVLLAVVAVAVGVPAALLMSGSAQAKPQVYSAQQVLQAFKAQGIALRRAPDDNPYTDEVTFNGRRNAQLSIEVLDPAKLSTTQLSVTSCSGSAFPAIVSHGNLEVTSCSVSKADVLRINAALAHLQYSHEDALRVLPPTFVLQIGTSRTIDAATTLAAVDCVNGAATASQPLSPRMQASQIEAAEAPDIAGAQTDYAFLRWQRLTGSRFRFYCHS